MRQPAKIFAVVALLGSAGLSLAGGWAAVRGFEHLTLAAVTAERDIEDDSWAQVAVNGLDVHLTGTAPSEVSRFRFLRRVSAVVPARRLRDQTDVAIIDIATEPDYSLEVLRDLDSISLIGLVPVIGDSTPIADRITRLTPDAQLTNMLERVERDPPTLWIEALEFGIAALADLERAKLSVLPGQVSLSGVVADQAALDILTEQLQGRTPDGVVLDLDLTAPRPVISPFVFRASLGSDGQPVLEACTMETQAAADQILKRARSINDGTICDIGLGAPSAEWPEVVGLAMDALGDLSTGRIELTDARLHIAAAAGQDQSVFAATVDRLSGTLPAPYTMTSEAPPIASTAEPEGKARPPRFIAERAHTGEVVLSGDLQDAFYQDTTRTFAAAHFGHGTISDQTLVREDLPFGWSGRVVTGLEALALLHNGRLEVTGDAMVLRGSAGAEQVRGEVRALLSASLPSDTRITTEIEIVALPSTTSPDVVVPVDLCAEQVALTLGQNQIAFPPSQTDIDEASLPIVDEIARILKRCPGARFEIAGHTDSQGRDSSNMALSQARADSVLAALLEREVTLVFLTARGYGEQEPIAENDSEEGRAANRRIEFRLDDGTGPQTVPDAPTEISQDATNPSVDALDLTEGQEADEGAEGEDAAPTEDQVQADEADAGSPGASAAAPQQEPAAAGEAESPTSQDAGSDDVTETDTEAAAAVETEAEPVAGTDAPDAPATPENADDAPNTQADDRNSSGNILDRPRPRPQRLPQIEQGN